MTPFTWPSMNILLVTVLAISSLPATTSENSTMLDELFGAIRSQDLKAVDRLVDTDPSLLSKRNAQGISPLSWAAYVQQPEILATLRARRGTPDLYEACIVGDDSAVAAAIAGKPGSIDVPAPDGYTALGLAVFFGHPSVARLLIDAGADVNLRATNPQRVAPIHAALARKDMSTLELLLLHGADPNLSQEQGFRPLHEAALSGNLVSAALLLLFGADASLASGDGKRAADLARSKGHHTLAERIDASLARKAEPMP